MRMCMFCLHDVYMYVCVHICIYVCAYANTHTTAHTYIHKFTGFYILRPCFPHRFDIGLCLYVDRQTVQYLHMTGNTVPVTKDSTIFVTHAGNPASM